MESLEQTLLNRVKELENNISIYDRYTQDKSNPENGRKIVAFKLFYEIVAFNSLVQLIPDYVPGTGTNFVVANALRGVNEYVSIVNGTVVISSAYDDLLKQKDEYLKQQKKLI